MRAPVRAASAPDEKEPAQKRALEDHCSGKIALLVLALVLAEEIEARRELVDAMGAGIDLNGRAQLVVGIEVVVPAEEVAEIEAQVEIGRASCRERV